MAFTGIKTLPLLAGTIASASPWQALFARAGFRVYPFQMGAKVRTTSTGTAVQLYGLGQIAANDYIIFCDATAYGAANMFIPNLNKIRRATAVSTSDDAITIDAAVSITAGDYMLVIGADTSGTPKASPNYDGSTISLYSDNVGGTAVTPKYLQTTTGGAYIGWVASDTRAVDLLITNSSGVLQVVQPFVSTLPTQEVNQIRTYAAAGATPAVGGFRTVKVGQSGAMPITNLTGGVAGQLVSLLCTDGNSTIADSGNFKLNAAYAPVADDSITLIYDGTVWWEVARSAPTAAAGTTTTIWGEFVISDTTLANPAATFDFTSIPATYDELELRISARGDVSAVVATINLTLNNDSTTTNYDLLYHAGFISGGAATNATGTSTGSLNAGNMPAATADAGHFTQHLIRIGEYASTSKRKLVTCMVFTTANITMQDTDAALQSLLWENTAAVSRITLTPSSGNFATGSRVILIGRKQQSVRVT